MDRARNSYQRHRRLDPPAFRELDAAVVERGRVVVECRESALNEAADIVPVQERPVRLAGTFQPSEDLYREAARAQKLNERLFERTRAAGVLRI